MGIVIPFRHARSGSLNKASEIESFLLKVNAPSPLDSRLAELESLVVFSPEIRSSASASKDTLEFSGIQWGDVFLKTGDEYPFIFTLYTKSFVRRYFLLRGERITSSSKDIMLDRHLLSVNDIIQATIKWVNRYYPELRGLPISLESEEIIQELICDPGEEVIIPDSTELFFL